MAENDHDACPECGAPKVDGKNCREQLGEIGIWEFQDPELLREHFLTVATYNLQHPAQFTDEALAGLRSVYIKHLDEGLPVSEIRRMNARVYDGPKKVLKPAGERQPELKRWSRTIADVYIPQKPQGAAERVREWARAVRGEL